MKSLIIYTNLMYLSILFKSKIKHCLLQQKRFHTLPAPLPVPVKTYSNGDVDKERIIKENKGKSGAYCWTYL